MDDTIGHRDEGLVIKERYYGHSYEPLEDVISSISEDPGLRRDVMTFVKLVPQRSLDGMNIALLVAGYMLHLKTSISTRRARIHARIEAGPSQFEEALEECYSIIKHRCEDTDRPKVLRSIVRYCLFVKHVVGTVW